MAREERDARTASTSMSLYTCERSAPLRRRLRHTRGAVPYTRLAMRRPRLRTRRPHRQHKRVAPRVRSFDVLIHLRKKTVGAGSRAPRAPRAVVARRPPVGAPTWSEERLLNHAQERPATAQITSLAASACPSAATTSSVESSCSPRLDAKSFQEGRSGTEPPGRKRRCRAHAQAASSLGRVDGMPGPQCAGR
jgi:hypothetical protein